MIIYFIRKGVRYKISKMLKKELRAIFELLIKDIFKNIGPKTKISSKKLMFYEFEDGLYFNEECFSAGSLIKYEILDKIYQKEKEVNDSTSYELFQYISKIMYNKIKAREKVIRDTLDIYLIDKDIDYAFSEMFKKLDDSYGKYTLYLLTNLINLRDVDSVDIGKVTVKNLNEENIKELPQNIERSFKTNISEALATNKYLTPTQFLQEFKGSVILEISVEGIHLNNETSKIFEKSFAEFSNVFSYLSICENFLKNVRLDSYNIKTEDIRIFNYGFYDKIPHYFYLYDKNKPKYLKLINTEFQKIKLPKILFRIDKDSLEKIKKRCCLDNFNKIFQNQKKYGEISEKITRSMNWFYKEMVEEDATDRAIALFISLEILMSTKPDRFSSLTDDLAENLAIITQYSVKDRYETKKYFKNNIYQLRNDIMHRGKKVNTAKDFNTAERLKICLVWSLRWIIENIESFKENGKYKTEKLKEYFEKQKLK